MYKSLFLEGSSLSIGVVDIYVDKDRSMDIHIYTNQGVVRGG